MKHKVLAYLLSLAAITACGDSALDTTFAKQSDKIDTYVSKQLESHPEYRVVYDGGVVRLVVAEGEGAEAAKGDPVTFYYAGYNFNNGTIAPSTLFATNDPDIAASARWNVSDSTLFRKVTVTLGKDPLVSGLQTGLTGVRTGEDCYIFFTGKNGFGKHQLGTIPANAAICYHIRVEETDLE